jgi:hypothetical protein
MKCQHVFGLPMLLHGSLPLLLLTTVLQLQA